MLNILCLKAGKAYGPEYVNILFDMVRRNLAEGYPGRFCRCTCFDRCHQIPIWMRTHVEISGIRLHQNIPNPCDIFERTGINARMIERTRQRRHTCT